MIHCASVCSFVTSVLTISLLMKMQSCAVQRNPIQMKDGISRIML